MPMVRSEARAVDHAAAPAVPAGTLRCMTDRTQALLREALSLPDGERADLASKLLASLDEPTGDDLAAVRDLWAQEIEGRARRVLTGESDGEDWDQVRKRLGRTLTDG